VDDTNDVRLQQQRQVVDSASSSSVHQHHTEEVIPPLHDTPAQVLDEAYLAQQSYNSFDLSAESILLLDQAFMGDFNSGEWNVEMLDSGLQLNLPPDGEPGTQTCDESVKAPPSQFLIQKDLWTSCGIDESTFTVSLQAFFSFASLALPILFVDAFRKDCEIGKCSDALVYAVACRGMPFVDMENRFEVQQRLAQQFKVSFLERQQTSSCGSVLRLDDIEALALMVGFHYEETHGSSTSLRFESLFLSHDSLVLATLQCRQQGGSHEQLDSQPTLAKERLALLFWHVYGLDVFHNLDYKSMSRIPDSYTDTGDTLPRSDTVGYLDAILGLAVVGRRILQLLCSSSARRHGVPLENIKDLYRHIKSWRQTSCPVHLQRHLNESGQAITAEHSLSKQQPEQHVQLQRAVLWLLEINCYMQIESCVDEYGIHHAGTALEQDLATVLVRQETLRAVDEATRIVKWINLNNCSNASDAKCSLADLSPNIVRDICAGLSRWTCASGQNLFRRGTTSDRPYRVISARDSKSQIESLSEEAVSRAHGYLEISREFRNVVASAVLHRDTKEMVRRLDEFITTVDGEMKRKVRI
jgi:hypothetical protein